MKGKLVVIEGNDSSGKKTQSELLIKRLKKEGYKTAYFDFPNYNSKTGKKIAAYLRREFGNLDEVSPYFAASLYAEDRAASRDKIAKQLKQNKVVVINRYVLSNKAHQSVKIKDKKERENFFKWVNELEYKKNKLPEEDILVYLYVPVKIIVEWNKKRKKREYLKGKEDIHETNVIYLKKVEKQYLELVEKNKKYIKISCVEKNRALSVKDIHKKIWDIVKKII